MLISFFNSPIMNTFKILRIHTSQKTTKTLLVIFDLIMYINIKKNLVHTTLVQTYNVVFNTFLNTK